MRKPTLVNGKMRYVHTVDKALAEWDSRCRITEFFEQLQAEQPTLQWTRKLFEAAVAVLEADSSESTADRVNRFLRPWTWVLGVLVLESWVVLVPGFGILNCFGSWFVNPGSSWFLVSKSCVVLVLGSNFLIFLDHKP